MPIDPKNDPYVLEGRVVTMGPAGVIEDGAIYIANGLIEAVKPANKSAPAGFEQARRIRSGDAIYPGMIELHNHLSYNAMPLWDVPKKYANNGQWRSTDAYRRQITKPSQVIGGTPGVVEALIRYVEMRALLGGVTTSQGISLSSQPGIKRYYKGLVRNVEQPIDPNLPAAGTKIGNPATGKAKKYLKTLKKKKCYLQHMSEGTDETARGWFYRLQMDNGEWAINDAFCAIHSTALNENELRIITDRGGSMVWSPLSNYLLYGATVDLAAAKNTDILMGLGSDWAPSGSKNLLGELKVAWLTSEEQGSVFTAEEIVAMVTRNAARIARWNEQLGTIEAGKRADLIAINGQKGDDYLRLIKARETSITLVVLDGIPRVGQVRLMDDFGPGTETIKVGNSLRVLNLAQDDIDPIVGDLTLKEATTRLDNAMANLPALASKLDNAFDNGLFGGSVDNSGTSWRVAFDMEEDDELLEAEFGIAAMPLTYYVTESIEFEAITVVDDRTHLRKLVAARNLPEFIKKGLPPLYGESIPIPHSAHFLEQAKQKLAPEVLSTTLDLATMLRTSGELSLDDRKLIVAQAQIVMEENYVHLPLKRAMHAVDPIQRLRLLRHKLNEEVAGELAPEIEFHNELSDIFNSVRDLHTSYRLPRPFSGKTAWLPFLLEDIWEQGVRKYIVSKLIADAGPETFKPGVVVTHWNGTPIHQAVLNNAERHAGSNEAARLARGLNSLTIRPLARGLPPDEDWVTLHYIDGQGNEHDWSQTWLVFEPRLGLNQVRPDSLTKEASALGLDDYVDDIHQSKKVLFAPVIAESETAIKSIGYGEVKQSHRGVLDTFLPSIFRAKKIKANNQKYGYIRIFSFNVTDADVFVDEFVRLAKQLPDNGLVIDVRGNGGGLIFAAEQLLQVLTPNEIEPERAQFINSSLNLQICRNHRQSTHFPGLSLHAWINSIKQSVETGATYSVGYPISDPQKCNSIGQRYFGPVVLIVDPLCYSATDIFAAGFKDHDIGPVLGVGDNTGAGGANVWSHGLLKVLMVPDRVDKLNSPYKSLPLDADFRVAMRRTIRVGLNAGDVLEDLGIRPDKVHHMTRKDVMENNEDLINSALELIKDRKPHGIQIELEYKGGTATAIRIITKNVERVDATLGDCQIRSHYPKRNKSRMDFQQELGEKPGKQLQLELRGYAGDAMVVRLRELLLLDKQRGSFKPDRAVPVD